MGSYLGAAVAPLLRPDCSTCHTCTHAQCEKATLQRMQAEVHTCMHMSVTFANCSVGDYGHSAGDLSTLVPMLTTLPISVQQQLCLPVNRTSQTEDFIGSQRRSAVVSGYAMTSRQQHTHHIIFGCPGRMHIGADHAVQKRAEEVVASDTALRRRVEQRPHRIVSRVGLRMA